MIPWSKPCEPELNPKFKDDQEALDVFVGHWGTLDPGIDQNPAFRNVKYYVLPKQRWKSGLIIVDIFSGSKEGASSLMNAIPAMLYNHGKPPEERDPTYRLDQPISPTGTTPNITTRPVIAMARRQHKNSTKSDLYERFPQLQPYEAPSDAVSEIESAPLLFDDIDLPDGVAVADTPNHSGGDPRISKEPRFLDVAERTLVSADVMVVIVNISTINNMDVLKSIRRTFDRYGRKQLVPILQDDRTISPEEAEEHLDRFAQIIYDLPPDHKGTPVGVIAKYLMPRDTLVRQKKAHVELIPLGGAPEFAELLHILGSNSKKYKEGALRAATEKFRMDGAAKVRAEYKSRLAAQLYRESLEALIHTVTQDHLVDFPYERAKRGWREALERQRSFPMQMLNRGAEVVGRFETGIPALMRELKKSSATEAAAAQSTSERATMTVYSKHAISELQNQLNSRYLRLIENPDGPNRRRAGDQLNARLESFYRLFPEERGNEEPCDALPGRVCVHLPRRELLTPAAQATLSQFLQADAGEMLGRVQQAEAVTLSVDSPEVTEAFKAIQKKRGVGVVSRDFLYDLGSVVSFSYLFWAIPSSSSFSGAAVLQGFLYGHVVARIIRMLGEYRRDETLIPQLNVWFRKLQLKAYQRIFHKHLLHDVFTAVALNEDENFTALSEMQEALLHMDPKLPEYPAELTEWISHKKD